MALTFADLVAETTTTSGTGTLTLSGTAYTANGPAQLFAAGIGSGNTCWYCITNGTTAFEVGQGTVGGSGPYTLSRDTVFASSTLSGGIPQKITLSGPSVVSNVLPAGKIPYPLRAQGTWSSTSAYQSYDVVRYGGGWYIADQTIAAPSSTVSVATSKTDFTSTSTPTITYSTAGADRLVVLVLDTDGGTTVSSVTSANVSWTKRTEDFFRTIEGYQNTVSVWYGIAGVQLTSEVITLNLTGSSSGHIIGFDISGLNLSVSPFDPNAALPSTLSQNNVSITNSFTTTNSHTKLLFIESESAFGTGLTLDGTAPTGFTAINSALTGNVNVAIFYKDVSTVQTSTSVTGGNGLSYRDIVSIADAVILPASAGNPNPSVDTDRWTEIGAVDSTGLDNAFGSTQGNILYRGASAWSVLAPGTSGQVLTTGGASANPSWTTPSSGGGGGGGGLYSGLLSAIPTQTGTGLSSSNTGGGLYTGVTVSDSSGGIVMSFPGAGSADVSGSYIAIAAPTAPYTITALIGTAAGSGSGGSGISGSRFGWSDGTKSQVIRLGSTNAGIGDQATVTNYSARGTWNANLFASSTSADPMWQQIKDDGTNVSFGISADGVNFTTLYSVAKASGYLSSYSNIVVGGDAAWSCDVTLMSWNTGSTSGTRSAAGLFANNMSATPTISGMGLTTWFNQGSATISNRSGGVTVTVPASSSTNVRGMYFPVPTPPYSYKALLAVTSSTSAYAYTMLGWYNGSSTLSVFSLVSNNSMGGNIEMDNWTATGFSGSNVGQFFVGINPLWARIRDDGTNVHFAYSTTGDDNEFIDVYSVAKASGTLGSSGYSNIFFGGNSQNSAIVYAACLSWAQGT